MSWSCVYQKKEEKKKKNKTSNEVVTVKLCIKNNSNMMVDVGTIPDRRDLNVWYPSKS